MEESQGIAVSTEDRQVIQKHLLDQRSHIIKKLGVPLRYFEAAISELGHEPVVGYLSGGSFIVLNDYGALVQCSTDLFIADIDIGDFRLDGRAGGKDVQEIIGNLRDLSILDKLLREEYEGRLDEQRSWQEFQKMMGELAGEEVTFEPPPVFAQQSYRVYQTAGGVRVICTSMPLYYGTKAERLLRFLRADPTYAEFCKKTKKYRARLTPKPTRDEPVVCLLVDSIGPGAVHPALAEQVKVHDAMTLTSLPSLSRRPTPGHDEGVTDRKLMTDPDRITFVDR